MGSLIERKKRLMMQSEETYIMNGLVLWMDGIDKGNITGAWVDKVSGYVFEASSSVVFGDNYVQTNGSDAYLLNETFRTPITDRGSIEVVISENNNVLGARVVYMPDAIGVIGFAFYGNGDQVLWNTNSSDHKKQAKGVLGAKTISIVSEELMYADGIQLTNTLADFIGGVSAGKNYIGKRIGGNAFDGKINCIRIYNRKITAEEILHNQRLDNKRFNLGLTI